MITQLTIVVSDRVDVFYNQALEKRLLDGVLDGEYVLYLWRNDNAVVIGKHQNAFAEVNTSLLAQDGGSLARRISGGGAVYHDLGNVNFTFIAKQDFSLELNRAVVLSALNALGLNAVLTGRNDIEIGGYKVSGNAYYSGGGRHLHHGTMLITSPAQKVAKYLTPSQEKFRGKAVKSVESRVSCLSAFDDSVDADRFMQEISTAFVSAFDAPVRERSNADFGDLTECAQEFACEKWRLNPFCEYDCKITVSREQGDCEVLLKLTGDIVTDCIVYTDSLDVTLADKVREEYLGKHIVL